MARHEKSSCYCCLDREPNAVVAPIHLKGMPVILTTPEERDVASSSCLPVNRSKPRGSICVSAVQALGDCRRWLRRTAQAFHPQQ